MNANFANTPQPLECTFVWQTYRDQSLLLQVVKVDKNGDNYYYLLLITYLFFEVGKTVLSIKK